MGVDIKSLIIEVLDQGYLMSLGVQDEGGVWVSDVNYVFDEDLNIYWMSEPHFRHSKAILKNNNVAGAITVSSPKEDNFGIQFSGVAKKLDGQRYDLIKRYCKKKNKPDPIEGEDWLEGYSWYVLKPNKMELICERYFGYDKQIWIK